MAPAQLAITSLTTQRSSLRSYRSPQALPPTTNPPPRLSCPLSSLVAHKPQAQRGNRRRHGEAHRRDSTPSRASTAQQEQKPKQGASQSICCVSVLHYHHCIGVKLGEQKLNSADHPSVMVVKQNRPVDEKHEQRRPYIKQRIATTRASRASTQSNAST